MFITDPSDADDIGRAHKEVFGDAEPVATMVVVAALLDPAWKVEIEVDRLEQLAEVLEVGGADVVLLDNMDTPTLREAVATAIEEMNSSLGEVARNSAKASPVPQHNSPQRPSRASPISSRSTRS